MTTPTPTPATPTSTAAAPAKPEAKAAAAALWQGLCALAAYVEPRIAELDPAKNPDDFANVVRLYGGDAAGVVLIPGYPITELAKD